MVKAIEKHITFYEAHDEVFKTYYGNSAYGKKTILNHSILCMNYDPEN